MRMRKIITGIFILLLLVGTWAEARIWNLDNGRTIEAEFLTMIGGKVSLKTIKGKTIKVEASKLSEEDLKYIELVSPPRLDLSLSKKSKVRVFPDSLSDLPNSAYHDFKAVIKQTSSKQYSYDLTAELFVIGREKIGDGIQTLLDYQRETFTLDKGSGSVFELPSRTVELMQFEMNGQLMGEEYMGYMIIVTDSRGEVIAHVTKRDEWFDIVDNLRVLPIGKYFDDQGNRCFTSPPKRWH